MANKVKVEKWSAEDAEKALVHNHVNRRLRPTKVKQYVRDMQDGRWTFCPDPITFDESGALINGQHRLSAQVEAGVTLEWIVVREADEGVQKTMDTGANRSLGDLIGFEGIGNAQTVGAVARLALQMDSGRVYLQKRDAGASSAEVLDFLQNNRSIIHSTEIARQTFKSGILQTRPSALGAAHWWIAKHTTTADADDFLQRIGSLVNEREGSPVIALVKRLNEITRNKVRIESRWLVFMIIKAWNYDVEGAKTTKISSTTRTGEYQLLTPNPRKDSSADDAEKD